MIKYFCERCEKELPEPYCLYTTGHTLCDPCLRIVVEENTKNGITTFPNIIPLSTFLEDKNAKLDSTR